MPASSAACLTGLGVSFKPRPAGRSGCVMTRGISWPAARRASNAIRANSGVPAKTMRMRVTAEEVNGGGRAKKGRNPARGSGAQRFALGLLEPRLDAVLLEVRQV